MSIWNDCNIATFYRSTCTKPGQWASWICVTSSLVIEVPVPSQDSERSRICVTSPLFIEVPVPSQDSERSWICVTSPLFIEVPVPRQDSEPSWICVGIINFVPVHDFSLILWNCPDSVVCLVFHFMRYSSQYSHVLRAQLLTQKLLKQFYIPPWLKSSLQTSTVDITIKLTATKYPYLTWQSIFTFYEDIFFLLSVPRLLQDLTVYMSNTVGVLSEAGTTYPLRAYAFTPVCWWGPGRSSC